VVVKIEFGALDVFGIVVVDLEVNETLELSTLDIAVLESAEVVEPLPSL